MEPTHDYHGVRVHYYYSRCVRGVRLETVSALLNDQQRWVGGDGNKFGMKEADWAAVSEMLKMFDRYLSLFFGR